MFGMGEAQPSSDDSVLFFDDEERGQPGSLQEGDGLPTMGKGKKRGALEKSIATNLPFQRNNRLIM